MGGFFFVNLRSNNNYSIMLLLQNKYDKSVYSIL